MQPLFHILPDLTWRAVVGEYVPDSLEAEGFIHFSFREQVHATRHKHYAGVPELVVLEVDPERLDDPVRIEDTYGSGEEFPHLYGPLPTVAVVAVHPIEDFTA